MAKPVPSQNEQQAINQQVANYQNQQQAFSDSAQLQDVEIARYQQIDNAFKSLFDYYNLNIIGQYDLERKNINGTFVISPISEADLQQVSDIPPSGRLLPTPPATNILRIPEFDGTLYAGVEDNNELQNIVEQQFIQETLRNGIPGSSPSINASTATTSNLDANSTTLSVTDSMTSISFAVGNIMIVHDGGSKAAIVEITSVTDNMGGNPPYNFTLGVEVLIPPVGVIASGANLIASFSGFNNTERTNKVASNPFLQPLMDNLITMLALAINARVSNIVQQLLALSLNEDEEGAAEIATATANANLSLPFLQNYVITMDISNTGLDGLDSERNARETYLNQRILEILNAYTGRTENFYDKRYEIANARGNTQIGTLRTLKNAQYTKDSLNGLAATLGSAIDSLESILP